MCLLSPTLANKYLVQMLAVCGKWSSFATDNGGDYSAGIPDHPTPEQVAAIQQRMYGQSDARRALGLNMRKTVLRKFDGDRYLREHEQMLWIGQEVHYARQKLYQSQGEKQVASHRVNLERELRKAARPADVRGFSAFSSSAQSVRSSIMV